MYLKALENSLEDLMNEENATKQYIFLYCMGIQSIQMLQFQKSYN